MNKLEIFFDYICPYCQKSYEHLSEIITQYPAIEILWRPCESHPRPDPYEPHSDMCIQGFFYAAEKGADLWEYNTRMYNAALNDKVNIEDVNVLAETVKGLLDPGDFRLSLQNGTYAKELQNSNEYAFNESGVWAVPAYRLNGEKLDAALNIGVTKEQLAGFLSRNYVVAKPT